MEVDKLRRILERASAEFASIDINRIADEAIAKAVDQFPKNDTECSVYTKAILVNTLYRTAIQDIVGVARHILAKKIDAKLEAKDLSVVDDIRLGHGVGGEQERNLYSFATKYVHFHRPNAYPIFDNLVKRLLSNLNKRMNFHDRFTQADLRIYCKYKSVVDAFARHLEIGDWGYKKLDQGLWVYAKYCYDELPSELEDKLEKMEDAYSPVD